MGNDAGTPIEDINLIGILKDLDFEIEPTETPGTWRF